MGKILPPFPTDTDQKLFLQMPVRKGEMMVKGSCMQTSKYCGERMHEDTRLPLGECKNQPGHLTTVVLWSLPSQRELPGRWDFQRSNVKDDS